jgi:hypothetical protein
MRICRAINHFRARLSGNCVAPILERSHSAWSAFFEWLQGTFTYWIFPYEIHLSGYPSESPVSGKVRYKNDLVCNTRHISIEKTGNSSNFKSEKMFLLTNDIRYE